MLKERALLEGFLRQHEQASNLIRENTDEAARIVAHEVKAVDAGFVKKVFSISPHYCAALPEPYCRAAMAFVPVLREQGAIERELAEQKVFDFSFIRQVHPGPHHY